MKTYGDIKPFLKPYDGILFKGTDGISKIIQIGEQFELNNDEFSHIGIVITSELLPWLTQLQKDRFYLLESTINIGSNCVPDIIIGQGRMGVQIRDLEEVITVYLKTHQAKIAWCPLIDNPWIQKKEETNQIYQLRRHELLMIFRKFYDINGQKIYDYSILDLLSALFPYLRPIRNSLNEVIIEGHRLLTTFKITKPEKIDKEKMWEAELNLEQTRLFCSELVTMLYQMNNIIDPILNPADVVPVDFLGHDGRMKKVLDDPIYLK